MTLQQILKLNNNRIAVADEHLDNTEDSIGQKSKCYIFEMFKVFEVNLKIQSNDNNIGLSVF